MNWPNDRAAVAAFPELRRLIDLRDQGWHLMPVVDDNDEIALVQGVRTYPGGWADAIGVRHTTDARALRCDYTGGVVWKRSGGLVEVIDGLIELPHPEAPGAPRLVRANIATLLVPSRSTVNRAKLLV